MSLGRWVGTHRQIKKRTHKGKCTQCKKKLSMYNTSSICFACIEKNEEAFDKITKEDWMKYAEKLPTYKEKIKKAEILTEAMLKDDLYKQPTDRGAVLDEAKKIINKDRQDAYGNPEDCFERIAYFWSRHTGSTITAQDVCMMMVLLKIAREQSNHRHDNIVDACGYLALYESLKKAEAK